MIQILILITCILLIVVCFVVATKSEKQKENKTSVLSIPDIIQNAFKGFADDLLIKEDILLEDAKILRWELVAEVPFEQGNFEYYRIEYTIVPESPVENSKGIVLNSVEIIAKAGIKDTLLVLFFKEKEEIAEVSFIAEKIVAFQGYQAYIDSRYVNVKEWETIEEYSLISNEKKITLWDNWAGSELKKGLNLDRTNAQGELSNVAQYVDIFENESIQIYSWVQFEKKRELVYIIKAKTEEFETLRGISVGCTIEELKEKYSINLSFNEDLNGEGPAYGYIPEDDTNRYIAFKVDEGIITEIIITDGFGERPFTPKEGYIDQDVNWIEVNYEEKLTEKYARALYLGQHKIDLDSNQVFNTFILNNYNSGTVMEKGLWKEKGRERIYFAIYESNTDTSKLYIEVKSKQIIINTSVKDITIWVVTHHRSQKKR